MTNLDAKGAKRSVKMWTTTFYKNFSKMFCSVVCHKFVQYIRMLCPGRFILVESVRIVLVSIQKSFMEDEIRLSFKKKSQKRGCYVGKVTISPSPFFLLSIRTCYFSEPTREVSKVQDLRNTGSLLKIYWNLIFKSIKVNLYFHNEEINEFLHD